MKHLRNWIVVATLVLLVAASSPAAFGAEAALRIASHQIEHNVIHVTVENCSSASRSGTVQVDVVVGGVEVRGLVPVFVMEQDSAVVTVGFPQTIEETRDLSIKEDPNPFG